MRFPISALCGAALAVMALIGTATLSAAPADAHFFHRWGYGWAGGPWFQPWFHPRPWFYPRVGFYAAPPPPPVYVVPRPVAYWVPPPVVYGYRYRVVRRVVHPVVHHVAARAVAHHWCSCSCCH